MKTDFTVIAQIRLESEEKRDTARAYCMEALGIDINLFPIEAEEEIWVKEDRFEGVAVARYISHDLDPLLEAHQRRWEMIYQLS